MPGWNGHPRSLPEIGEGSREREALPPPNHAAVAWQQRVQSRETMAGRAVPVGGCRPRRMPEVPMAGVGSTLGRKRVDAGGWW